MPPEMNPWQRHVYLAGPIKLPKPAIIPRKNSVASLEPFQEVIDQVYQEALAIPRRRSDDAVVDDICDWFDEFGFEEVGFEGDKIVVDVTDIDDPKVIDEDRVGIERYSTPSTEPDVDPLEKAVAKEVVGMARPDPMPKPPVPPLDNEDSLRARGIARLTQQGVNAQRASNGRKESLTLPRADKSLLFTPVPEEGMLKDTPELQAAGVYAKAKPGTSDQSTFLRALELDGEVEEMDAQPTWIASALQPRKHATEGLPAKQARNPVTNVRRIVATTSAML